MKTTKVTFENNAGTEKAVVTVKWNKDQSMDVSCAFIPEMNAKKKMKQHQQLALFFVKQLSS